MSAIEELEKLCGKEKKSDRKLCRKLRRLKKRETALVKEIRKLDKRMHRTTNEIAGSIANAGAELKSLRHRIALLESGVAK